LLQWRKRLAQSHWGHTRQISRSVRIHIKAFNVSWPAIINIIFGPHEMIIYRPVRIHWSISALTSSQSRLRRHAKFSAGHRSLVPLILRRRNFSQRSGHPMRFELKWVGLWRYVPCMTSGYIDFFETALRFLYQVDLITFFMLLMPRPTPRGSSWNVVSKCIEGFVTACSNVNTFYNFRVRFDLGPYIIYNVIQKNSCRQ